MEEDSMWECVVEYRLRPLGETRFTEKFLSRNPIGSIEVAARKVEKVAYTPFGRVMHAEIVGWTNKLVPLV